MTQAPSLYEVKQQKLRYHFHPGQYRAWQSLRRIILVLAGTQGGKTSFGPVWLLREMQRRGPGDYLAVTPTYPLLSLKLLPEFERLFVKLLHLGKLTTNPRPIFHLSDYGAAFLFGSSTGETTRVVFGHAQDPEGLEAATAKAALLDEAGQRKFKRDSYYAILRRLSIYRGRILITTTPYNHGWLKTELHDAALNKLRDDIELVRFESRMNPAFSEAEWRDAQLHLPGWKFDMFYRALFTRPAGLIYDNFDRADVVAPFELPADWPRYIGMDFGGVNTAAVMFANEPGTKEFFLYRDYLAGSKTTEQHVRDLTRGELPFRLGAGGAPSEDQWRREFTNAGLNLIRPRISDVEVGIDRVYGLHATHAIKVFKSCQGYLDQKYTYSRVLDDSDQPTEAIQDKSAYHYLDAERYIAQFFAEANSGWGVEVSSG